MAQYVMPASGLRRVADLVDVDSDKWRQYAATQPWPRSAIYRREGRALLRYEREIARRFDATVFVSAAEAELFKRFAPESAQTRCGTSTTASIATTSLHRAGTPTPMARASGCWCSPARWTIGPTWTRSSGSHAEFFPESARRVPDARFCIVGTRPAAEVMRLAELPGVTVTGAVPDIRPYLAHAKFAVAPLRMARGVQNKVLEAMAMAKPVLASPQAAEGIDAKIGSELLVAADETDFVRQASLLLEDDGGSPIGVAGRARVLASYAWESSLSRFEHLLSGSMPS